MPNLSRVMGAALAVGLVSSPAFAQDVRAASEKVVACQSVVDPMERLACFEGAALELSAMLAVPTAEAAPAPEVVPALPEAPPIQQAATAAPAPTVTPAPTETTVAPAVPAAPVAEPAPVQQAAVDVPAEDPNVPRSSLPSWIPRVTFGSGRDVEKEPDEYQTTITRIQRNRLGRHFFTTAEGHVWKQKKIEEIRAPKSIPAEAILYQNITGGILIKITETNRSYRVDRVE